MPLREVIEEARYSREFDVLREQYPSLDDLQSDLSWTLSRDPKIGASLLFAPEFYLFTTNKLGKTPAFHILYTFDEERVYLQSIAPASK